VYEGFRFQDLWVVTSVDDHDEENLVMMTTPVGAEPMIATDEVRLRDLEAIIAGVQSELNNVSIKHFKLVED
jgi:hypothetical protein